jgi:hypothetical protein
MQENGKTKKRKTKLQLAARDNDMNGIISEIINGADINEQCRYKMTPLHCALYRPYLKTIKYLLDNGADPTIEDYYKTTAYHKAAQRNDIEILKLFLEYKGTLLLKNEKSGTLLHSATFCNRDKSFECSYWDTIEYLLENGVDHEFKNDHGHIARDYVSVDDYNKYDELILKYKK